MIAPDKHYATKGHFGDCIFPVTIFTTTARGEFPVVGIIHKKESDSPESWTSRGFRTKHGEADYANLQEITKEQWEALKGVSKH